MVLRGASAATMAPMARESRWIAPIWLLINGAQAIALVIWTILWGLICLVLALIRPSLAMPMVTKCWAPFLVVGSGARLRVSGRDGVDFDRPHVFVANHRSMLDIVIVLRALPTPLWFVAKQELRDVPIMGWFGRAVGMIFVDRARRERAIRALGAGVGLLRAGKSVLAFPEGTRSRDVALLPLKKGPFVLAIEAGVPIVPVAILRLSADLARLAAEAGAPAQAAKDPATRDARPDRGPFHIRP